MMSLQILGKKKSVVVAVMAAIVNIGGSGIGAQWFPTGKNLAVSEIRGMWDLYL